MTDGFPPRFAQPTGHAFGLPSVYPSLRFFLRNLVGFSRIRSSVTVKASASPVGETAQLPSGTRWLARNRRYEYTPRDKSVLEDNQTTFSAMVPVPRKVRHLDRAPRSAPLDSRASGISPHASGKSPEAEGWFAFARFGPILRPVSARLESASPLVTRSPPAFGRTCRRMTARTSKRRFMPNGA
jgi:hypothetical protein